MTEEKLKERKDFLETRISELDELAANPEQIVKAVKKINGTIRGQFAHHKTGTMIMTTPRPSALPAVRPDRRDLRRRA